MKLDELAERRIYESTVIILPMKFRGGNRIARPHHRAALAGCGAPMCPGGGARQAYHSREDSKDLLRQRWNLTSFPALILRELSRVVALVRGPGSRHRVSQKPLQRRLPRPPEAGRCPKNL